MRPIDTDIITHTTTYRDEPVGIRPGLVSFDTPRETIAITRLQKVSQAHLRIAPPYEVTSFRDLVHHVAQLGYYNHRYNLLFRGQRHEHLNAKGKTMLYPTIYRPPTGKRSLARSILSKRLECLMQAVRILRDRQGQIGMSGPLRDFEQYYMAVLQHYRVCPTPLLDLTQSIRVASSFALNRTREGYVFVFGLPHPHGSISFYSDEQIVLVKLQNVCPADALRPHFQEGYLVGRWPNGPSKEKGDNAAYRLVGRYRLNAVKDFWDRDFQPVPMPALLPDHDPFHDKIKEALQSSGWMYPADLK